MRSSNPPGAGRTLTLCLFCLLCAAGAAFAGVGDEFENRLQAAVEQEGLSPEDILLHRFRYVFAPDDLPPELRVPQPSPRRCATTLVRSYREAVADLSPAATVEIEAYLEPNGMAAAQLSPGGLFRLEYAVSGADAVPLADVDPADGVPDYVQRLGEILETAWVAEFVRDGFAAPIPPEPGPYPVELRDMAAYGFTQAVDAGSGASRIILHNNFEDFPPNDDPEGDRWGAAKVAAAHELKHASQYAASRWSEGGWIELDAVWAEERVFDEVNDYYQFLTGESPLRQPGLPLDAGATGTGSYEDAVWQIWLEETYGVEIVADFWDRRAGAAESVLATWQHVLDGRGSTWTEAWARFAGCNYGTDVRAAAGAGYDEAAVYPCGPAAAQDSDRPLLASGAVEHLAACAFRLDGFADTADPADSGGNDRLEVILQPLSGDGLLTLAVHVTYRDGTGAIEIATPGPEGVIRHRLSDPWGELESVGIIVGNAATAGTATAFALVADRVDPALDSPVLPGESPLAVELASGERSERELELINVAGEARAYSVHARGSDPRVDAVPDPAPAWLTCDAAGSLPAAARSTVTLLLDAAALEPGPRTAWLEIRTEGFADAEIVPVTLEVTTARVRAARLRGAHPNPFNPVTWLAYDLPAAGPVRLDVLDVRGRVVCRLVDDVRAAGTHRSAWDGRDGRGAPLGAGVYLARLRTAAGESTCKMILTK